MWYKYSNTSICVDYKPWNSTKFKKKTKERQKNRRLHRKKRQSKKKKKIEKKEEKKSSPSRLSMYKLLTREFENWHCQHRERAQQWRAWHKTTRCVLFPLSFPRTPHQGSCHSEDAHSAPSCHCWLPQWPARQVSPLWGTVVLPSLCLSLLTSSCSGWDLWDTDPLHTHFKKPAGTATFIALLTYF